MEEGQPLIAESVEKENALCHLSYELHVVDS